jgi:hypothetical protein
MEIFHDLVFGLVLGVVLVFVLELDLLLDLVLVEYLFSSEVWDVVVVAVFVVVLVFWLMMVFYHILGVPELYEKNTKVVGTMNNLVVVRMTNVNELILIR